MLYTDRMIIKKETILNKKTQLCKINKGDVLRINEESDESRFTVYPDVPDVIVGTALPLNTPILTYGCDSNGIYHILYFAYCGTDSQNAAAVGISKTTFEKYGHDIYSDRFLCDLSVPREERLGALRLEDPIILVDDLGVALGVGTTDQEDIYLAKKYRQCLKASAYFSSDIVYCPQSIIIKNPFLLANPAVGFTYQECSDIAQASENDDAFNSDTRIYTLIRDQLGKEEWDGAIWTDSTRLLQLVIAFSKNEDHPLAMTSIKKALNNRSQLSKELITRSKNGYCTTQSYDLLEECISLIRKLPSKQLKSQKVIFKALCGTSNSHSYANNVSQVFKIISEKSFCIVQSKDAKKLTSLMENTKEVCKHSAIKLRSIKSKKPKQAIEYLSEDATDLIVIPDGENITVMLLREILKLQTGGIILFVNSGEKSSTGRQLLYQSLIKRSQISTIALDDNRHLEVENNDKQVNSNSRNKELAPKRSRPANKQEVRTYSGRDPEKFINYLRSQHVRYKYKTFNNATDKEVMEWIDNNNVTIISYTGRLYEYSTSKTIFSKTEWKFYFKYLKLKYYPRKPKYEQSWYYISRYTIGAYHLHDDIKNQLERENGKIIGSPIYTEYHISGGHGDTKTLTFYFYAY